MPTCFFATDLHGYCDRYEKLISSITRERPNAVFLGGDLLPRSMFSLTPLSSDQPDFLKDYLLPTFTKLRQLLGTEYPAIFLILGNDDPQWQEEQFQTESAQKIWHYAHGQKVILNSSSVYGYACALNGNIRLRGDTKELMFTDPDNIRVQLQDVSYTGGVGPLGNRYPK